MKQKFGTFFIVPFYCNKSNKAQWPNINIWCKQTKRPTRESLYGEEDRGTILPHIMQLLQGQTYQIDSDVQPWSIYELNKKCRFYSELWKPLSERPLSAILQPQKEDKEGNIVCKERIVEFSVDCGDTLQSPHMFINDKADVGILVFHVKVKKADDINDLIDLNYAFHKLNEPCLCRCNDFSIKQPADKIQNQTKPKIEWEISCLIGMLFGNHLTNKTPDDSTTEVEYLRNGKKMSVNNSYQLYSGSRIHLFTYATLDGANLTSDADIDRALVRLSRCVNSKYSLPIQQIIADGGILHTFENVGFASSVEGCSCIAIGQKDLNEAFVSDFPSQLMYRYLWLYMLAIMQRFTMSGISSRLLEVEATLERRRNEPQPGGGKTDDTELWKLLNVYKHLKVTSYWMDVSPFSQHSQFFHFCCQHLHVQDTYDELDSKLDAIRLVEEHEINSNLRKQEKSEAKRDRNLSLLVAILTGVQAIGVAHSISGGNIYAVIAGVVVIMVLLCILLRKSK